MNSDPQLRHQRFGAHVGMRSSGKSWASFQTATRPYWDSGCNPRPKDVELATRRLRLDPDVHTTWLKLHDEPELAATEAAIRRARNHRLMHMFDCANNLDNPLDWLLHTPTPH